MRARFDIPHSTFDTRAHSHKDFRCDGGPRRCRHSQTMDAPRRFRSLICILGSGAAKVERRATTSYVIMTRDIRICDSPNVRSSKSESPVRLVRSEFRRVLCVGRRRIRSVQRAGESEGAPRAGDCVLWCHIFVLFARTFLLCGPRRRSSIWWWRTLLLLLLLFLFSFLQVFFADHRTRALGAHSTQMAAQNRARQEGDTTDANLVCKSLRERDCEPRDSH